MNINVTHDRYATLEVAPALAGELIAGTDEAAALGTTPFDLGSSSEAGGTL